MMHGHKNVGASKPMFNKKSKQDLAQKKMSFRHGSGGSRTSHKSSGISPSVEEFEKMVSSASSKSPKKKSMFRKKA